MGKTRTLGVTDIHKISRNKLKFVVALTLLTIICVGSLVQEWNFGSEDATSSIFNNINNTSQKDYYELYNDTHQQSSSSSLLSKNISTKTTSTIAADDRIVCSTATNENNENENVTCIDPVGLNGEWVWLGNNRTFDSPECCGWADKKQTINDIILGEENGKCNMNITKYMEVSKIEFGLHNGDANYPSMVGWNACECNDFVDEYVWESPTLDQHFNASDTCRMLRNRKVLYIGDSTGHEVASTLMNSFRPMGETCHTNIYFAISDTLIRQKYGAMNRGWRWNRYVQKVNPDIVIVSVGAHINANDTVYLSIVDQVLHEMVEMKKERPNIQFAWQTQVPAGCTDNITSPHNVSIAGEMSMKLPNYNHGRFFQRDLMLISRLQEIQMPYLDLRMLYSRTDSHVNLQADGMKVADCLHICVPGPLDVIGRLFHKLLLEMEENSTQLN